MQCCHNVFRELVNVANHACKHLFNAFSATYVFTALNLGKVNFYSYRVVGKKEYSLPHLMIQYTLPQALYRPSSRHYYISIQIYLCGFYLYFLLEGLISYCGGY